jgi:hypothetical protein
VCFKLPSSKELLCHAYMVCASSTFFFCQLSHCGFLWSLRVSFCFAMQVCAAEGANIHPHLLERLIGSCRGDIRKIIMHLQFWCQGKRFRRGQLRNVCLHGIYMHVIVVYALVLVTILLDYLQQLSLLHCCYKSYIF